MKAIINPSDKAIIAQKRSSGLLRRRRRTYAWATLCVTPYFVYGLTEVVANPGVRLAAGAILLASLAWFVALVAFLRWSRSTGPGAQGTPPA